MRQSDPDFVCWIASSSDAKAPKLKRRSAVIDHVAIMQAGGWKTSNVLAHYVENASTRAIYARRW
jgi:hypothetical protein